MRNFEERMAEINRRSKEIIKARRTKRRRVLMACIPLMLCTCLCLPFLQNVLPGDKSANTMGGVTGESAQESAMNDGRTGQDVVKIQVSGKGISKCVSEKEAIANIIALLDAEYSAMTGSDSTSESSENVTLAGSGSDQGYTIVLYQQNGEPVQYWLNGSKVENQSTKQTHELTQQQLQELKDLLEISR